MTHLLSYKEASQLLGRSEQTLRIDVMNRRIPYTKIGRQVRFVQDDLEQWVKQNTVQPVNQNAN